MQTLVIFLTLSVGSQEMPQAGYMHISPQGIEILETFNHSAFLQLQFRENFISTC